MKATWPEVPEAKGYQLYVHRENPTDFYSEFVSSGPWFYLKLYPWRLYHWRVQALDDKGQPLGPLIHGPDIYLESSLFPRPEEVDVNSMEFLAIDEGEGLSDKVSGLTAVVSDDSQSEISPPIEEPEQSTSGPMIFSLQGSVGGTAIGHDQKVTNSFDTTFSSAKAPSLALGVGLKKGRLQVNLSYRTSPGSIKTSLPLAGGADFNWNTLQASLGFEIAKDTFLGGFTGLAPVLFWQQDELPLLESSGFNNVSRRQPSISSLGFGLTSGYQVAEKWTIPLTLMVLSSLSDDRYLQIQSGQAWSLQTGLHWRWRPSLTPLLLIQTTQHDWTYRSAANNPGNLSTNIINVELGLQYSF